MTERRAPDRIDPASLNDYLAVMSKAIFQSGMSWRVVEAKWPGILEAFHGFDVQEIAGWSEPEIDELVQDTRVIRNRRQLRAIVANAQRLIELECEFGSLQGYLRSHGGFDATLKALHKDFGFMGPMTSYYFLYVVGEEVPPHEEFEATYRK